MRKFLVFFSLIVVLAIMTSSCAMHSGIGMSNASLSENNFKMVRYAQGSVKTTKIFGLGGLAKNALVAEAKEQMMSNYPLQDGQALANMTVDFKTSIVFFVITTKVTVTADIVQFQ
ncbi:MAG: hypothetical protein EOM23_02920 [Candidatus Moranbacteria bacterium]|nr:hypothetical protein [Candidatus Moranbacteria bacterium]